MSKVVKFKKKGRNKRKLHIKKNSLDMPPPQKLKSNSHAGSKDGGIDNSTVKNEEHDDTSQLLADLREGQRLRKVKAGISAESMMTFNARKRRELEEKMEKESTVAKIDGILDGAFDADTAHLKDPRLLDYIAKKLNKEMPPPRSAKKSQTSTTTEDDLYAVPESIRRDLQNSLAYGNDQKGQMMFSGTGLMEVALPVEFQLKNLRDTEKATNDLILKTLSAQPDKIEFEAPSNFSSNYEIHVDAEQAKRELIYKKREEKRIAKAEEAALPGPSLLNFGPAQDDQIMNGRWRRETRTQWSHG